MTTQHLVEVDHPLPSEEFEWRTPAEETHRLYRSGEYTGIHVRGIHTGTYIMSAGDQDIFETPSLRYAQISAHSLAWALRDKLPIPDPLTQAEPRVCDCDKANTEFRNC